jgi:hypothetical protein
MSITNSAVQRSDCATLPIFSGSFKIQEISEIFSSSCSVTPFRTINYIKTPVDSSSFYASGSKMRILWAILYRLISFFREIQRFFIKGSSKEREKLYENFEKYQSSVQILDGTQTMLQLFDNKPLGQKAMMVLTKTLDSQKAYVCDEFYEPKLYCLKEDRSLKKAKLPNILDENKLLFFPIIVKGFFIDHVLTIVVDPKNKRIEFYDSKGLTIMDRQYDLLFNFPDNTLLDLWKEIVNKYAKDGNWSVIENTHQQQKDLYNCGVFSVKFMIDRHEGISFENLVTSSPSFKDVSQTWRKKLMERVSQTFILRNDSPL